MRISDHIELALFNLLKRKLRTILTTLGVVVGIGALVSMISFGTGMQRNVTKSFQASELFNSITVFSEFASSQSKSEHKGREREGKERKTSNILDDKAIAAMEELKGVEAVFPEIRFPAMVRFNEREEFRLIQVIPARIAGSKLIKFRLGQPYYSDDEDSAILSDSLLKKLKVEDLTSVLGKKIEITSIAIEFKDLSAIDLPSLLEGRGLPFSKEIYKFTIKGIAERMGFEGSNPLRSEVFVPPGAAKKIKKLSFTSLWDLFRVREVGQEYSAVNVRLSSPKFVDSVQTQIEGMGFRTFALAEQFEEIKTGFIIVDMILAAVGMIAILVASLGIINTMVMSILERYSEIGVMKAVGASDKDIKKIFFFESSSIGFMGGVFGLGLGWVVSKIINQIINFFMAKQGVPFIEFFYFPWWLCLGAILFAVLVSLLSGIYPAMRAARVDPVVALRHD